MMSAFILGRTGGSQKALGMAEAAVSLGVLAGSVVVTFVKPPKNKIKVIFIIAFYISFGRCNAELLCCTLLLGSLLLFPMCRFAMGSEANIYSYACSCASRTVGRVFSARDTLQNITIPLGLFLAVFGLIMFFEPFMNRPSAIQHALALFFGAGKGSCIAVMFFIVGIIGFILSIAALRNPLYQSLNDSE